LRGARTGAALRFRLGSLEERCPSDDEYVDAVAAAANALARDRPLLEEDVPAYVKKAQDAPVGK
jgi:hypothetical protein